jgi:hypothetical protein
MGLRTIRSSLLLEEMAQDLFDVTGADAIP